MPTLCPRRVAKTSVDPFQLQLTFDQLASDVMMAGGAVTAASTAVIQSNRAGRVLRSGIARVAEVFPRILSGAHRESVALAQEAAHSNAEEFARRFFRQMLDMAEAGKLTEEQVLEAFARPAFASMFKSGLITSSETDDSKKHDALADVITRAMSMDSETPYAITARLAVEAVGKVTRQQLRIVGALYFLTDYRGPERLPASGDSAAGVTEYLRWLHEHSRPFIPLFPTPMDLPCLRSLGLLEQPDGPWLRVEAPNLPRIIALGVAAFGAEAVTKHVERELELWRCVLDASLTPTGLVLGGAVYANETGQGVDFSWWTT